jgi:DMSO/TMAO reductase YedYZ molybdopterin-dependent catalytic subunit
MSDLETHPIPESVDPEGWELAVDGLVDRPLALAIDDLRSMELVRASGDFSCVEGWTATDLTWRGVRVTDLLDRAGVRSAAEFALVRAMDGEYACGYPLDRLDGALLELDGALLALELDGDPLPVEHGGPARLVPATAESDEPEDTARDLALSRLE